MRGNIKKAVYAYLESMRTERIIGGWAIRDIIAQKTNSAVYPNVVLKVCKEWAFRSGGRFDCIDPIRSIYSFKPGKKIIGTPLEHMPVGSHVKAYRSMREHKA